MALGNFNRFRFDDVRRLGTQLLVAAGVSAERAPTFLNALLWFDAANAFKDGIDSLPEWLAAIERGEIDPKAEGSISLELTGTAVIDGKRGLAPLVMAKAARIAQEKAREMGAGLVRVTNLGGRVLPAPVAFDIAIGPMVGVVHGPGPSWTVAVPIMGSVPGVFDTSLGSTEIGSPTWSIKQLPSWSFPFAGGGDWLVTAYSVAAFEPLGVFHERIGAELSSKGKVAGEIRPEDWQKVRFDQYEHGISISPVTVANLKERAGRAKIEFPNAL
jgi:LDH2 family malate/lactate/ureidoglycolate dehydrogenase